MEVPYDTRNIVVMKKRSLFASVVCFSLLMSMSACDTMQSKNDSEAVEQVELAKLSDASENDASENKSEKTTPAEQQAVTLNRNTPSHQRQQILEVGTGQYTAPPSSKKQIETDAIEGDITLNFQGTDINEFTKVILGDILNENFVIDRQVSGTVTIETSKPVSKKELLPLLEEILAINNAVMIKSDGLYKILPRAKAIKGNLSPDVITQSTGFGYSVKIIPLEYIAAQEMQKILEPFVNDGGSVRIDKQRNMLILAGTPQELNTLQETIEIFDVDWLRGMSVGLYPLDYVDPKTLKSELDAILSGIEGEGSKKDELLGGLVRTLAIERLNSILLISSTTSALREAEIWLYRLDRPGDQIGQYLYVYDVQNAKATELADILGQIFDKGSSSSGSFPAPALAPGSTPVEIASEQNAATGSSELSLTASNSIEIIADDTRNALVILAAPRDYKMVKAAIQKLDVVPLQVLIEASILEVTLNDDLSYGVEWFFKDRVGASRTGQGQLALGEIAALVPSFSYTIIGNAADVRVALNALETESEINVLSSPSLMVLDNQTATINVGDEIPVPTRQSVSNIGSDAPTVNEIQYRSTGVTLTVTPRVNNSGLVTMDIRQEVSNAIATDFGVTDAPTIQQRQIETTVAINSGSTIVLGGLMQSTESESEGGVPLLHKIPLLGKLFGQTNKSVRKTELIVLLTPRVIRNNNDAREITDEFRRKLQNLPPVKVQTSNTENAS